jgi:hypothetical protein
MSWDMKYCTNLSRRLVHAHECATDVQKSDRWLEWLEMLCDSAEDDITRMALERLIDGSLDHVLRAWLARRP